MHRKRREVEKSPLVIVVAVCVAIAEWGVNRNSSYPGSSRSTSYQLRMAMAKTMMVGMPFSEMDELSTWDSSAQAG